MSFSCHSIVSPFTKIADVFTIPYATPKKKTTFFIEKRMRPFSQVNLKLNIVEYYCGSFLIFFAYLGTNAFLGYGTSVKNIRKLYVNHIINKRFFTGHLRDFSK